MTTFNDRGLIFVDLLMTKDNMDSCDQENNLGRVAVMDKVVPKLRSQVDEFPGHVFRGQDVS